MEWEFANIMEKTGQKMNVEMVLGHITLCGRAKPKDG